MKLSALPILLACCLASAQQKAPPASPQPSPTKDAAPEVPLDLREKFFKAYSEKMDADAQLQAAQQTEVQRNTALQGVVSQVQNICGKKYRAVRYPNQHDGEVFCELAPETPKK